MSEELNGRPDGPTAPRRSVFLKFRGDAREYPVEDLTTLRNGFVLKLGGVDTIGAAEALAGAEIQVPEDALEPLESGRIYVASGPVPVPQGGFTGFSLPWLFGKAETNDVDPAEVP